MFTNGKEGNTHINSIVIIDRYEKYYILYVFIELNIDSRKLDQSQP